MNFEPQDMPPVRRDFEQAATAPDEQAVEDKEHDKPEFNYDPPEPAPGGQGYARSDIDSVIREEMTSREQAAIREAREAERRFPERDSHTTLDFNDAADRDQEWTEDASREYEAWSRDGEEERNAGNTPESAAEFDARMREELNKRDRELNRDDHERE